MFKQAIHKMLQLDTRGVKILAAMQAITWSMFIFFGDLKQIFSFDILFQFVDPFTTGIIFLLYGICEIAAIVSNRRWPQEIMLFWSIIMFTYTASVVAIFHTITIYIIICFWIVLFNVLNMLQIWNIIPSKATPSQ